MPKIENPKPRRAKDAQVAAAPPWCAAAPPSHIGGRSEQQDARHIFHNSAKGTLLIVVCDGVGGSRSGGEASALVIKTADQLWKERGGVLQNPQRDLQAMSRTAHERICELASAGEKRAPASTLVVLYLTPDSAHWVHSGDSRLYHFRAGELVSRTRDHSVVQILLEQGEITESQMGDHPDQGRLLQSLGTKDYREPTYGTAQTGPADAFILCTDGFWERTPQRDMTSLLAGDSRSLEPRLSQAIKNAVAANGREGDNVTVAAVVPLSGLAAAAPPMPRWMPQALIATGILIAIGVIFFTTSGSETVSPNPQPKTGSQVPEVATNIRAPQPTGLGESAKSALPEAPKLKARPAQLRPKELEDIFERLRIRFSPVYLDDDHVVYMADTELTNTQWNIVEAGLEVAAHALAQRLGLAHVQHRVRRVAVDVDPGLVRQLGQAFAADAGARIGGGLAHVDPTR